jgi:hypothetical protein
MLWFGAILRARRTRGKAIMSDDIFLELDHFEPLVGKTTRFKGTRFEIPLERIIKGQKFVPNAKRDPFILIWRAPKEREHMPEGYYPCEFVDGPTYMIYVTPVFTPEPEFQDYQAVFN